MKNATGKEKNETPIAPVAPLPQFLMLGFAGKRNLSGGFASQAEGERALAAALEGEFAALETRYRKPLVNIVGVSALALGADTVFAECLLGRGGLMQAFLPERADLFFNLPDFGDEAALERSRRLLEHGNLIETRILRGDLPRNERFAECATDIVDACDVFLVAITTEEWAAFQEWMPPIAPARTELARVLEPKPEEDGKKKEKNQAPDPAMAAAAKALEDAEAIPASFSRGGSAETLCYAYLIGRECRVLVPDGGGAWSRNVLDDGAANCAKDVARHKPHGKARQVAQLGETGEGLREVFDPGLQPEPLETFDYRASMDNALKYADHMAGKGKNRFVRLTMAIVLIHICATVVASYALVWPYGHTFAAALKVLLLLSGLGLAVWLTCRRCRLQEGWVNHRLIAEMLRSARVLVGDVSKAVPPFFGSLKHLRDFYLPEFSQLIRSLNILHLREVKRAGVFNPDKTALKAFVKHYCNARIEDQRGYYARELKRGHRENERYEWAFFVFSSLALICAVVALAGCFGHEAAAVQQAVEAHKAVETDAWYVLFAIKFVPLVFPVLAAATMVLASIKDLGRRCGSYADMISVLDEARQPVHCSAGTRSMVSRVHRLEHQLLQENVEAYSSMRNLRAG